MIKVEIDSIRVSLMTQDRVVVLKDTQSDRYLPIWIGPFEADIDSIRVSLMTQDRVVVLKDTQSDRYLPIWIGPFEADALRVELAGMEVTRPLTHDLLKSVITQMGGKVEHVIV